MVPGNIFLLTYTEALLYLWTQTPVGWLAKVLGAGLPPPIHGWALVASPALHHSLSCLVIFLLLSLTPKTRLMTVVGRATEDDKGAAD